MGADGQLLSVDEMVTCRDGVGSTDDARIAADVPGYHDSTDRAHHIAAHQEWVEHQQSPNAPQTYRSSQGTGAAHPLDDEYSDAGQPV